MCTKPKDDAPAPRHPDHDPHAAGLYQAIALRFYARYMDARRLAEFRGEDLPDGAIQKGEINLQVGSHAISKLVPTFAHGAAGEAIAFVGSSGNLEIGVNKGSASKTLGLGRGTPVLLNKG